MPNRSVNEAVMDLARCAVRRMQDDSAIRVIAMGKGGPEIRYPALIAPGADSLDSHNHRQLGGARSRTPFANRAARAVRATATPRDRKQAKQSCSPMRAPHGVRSAGRFSHASRGAGGVALAW